MLRLNLVSGGTGLDLFASGPEDQKAVLVVVAGSGRAMFTGSGMRFEPGCVFFLHPGTSFRVVEGELAIGYLLSFGEGYLDYFLLQYPLTRALSLFSALSWLALDGKRLDVVQQRMRVIAADIERGAGFGQLKLVFALFLLDIVGDRLVVSGPSDDGRELMAAFNTLLEENFKRERSSGFYAGEMCMSTRKLNGLCRGWYNGKRFDQVLKERLLSEAEFLLLGSGLSVKAVAFELGFCSMQHFRGWFKKLKGVSPTVFRGITPAG